MSKVLIIHHSDCHYHWFFPATNTAESGDLHQFAARFTHSEMEVCLLLAESELRSLQLDYNHTERKYLTQSVPYQLEEQLLDPIEKVHVALGKTGRDSDVVNVAACNRTWLEQQLAPFREENIQLSSVIPVTQLLHTAVDITVFIFYRKALVRIKHGRDFSIDLEMAHPVLELAIAEYQASSVHICTEEDEESKTSGKFLIHTLHEKCPGITITNAESPLWQCLDIATEDTVDLRQGQFARQLPYHRWWNQWRGVAALALFALASYLASSSFNIYQLNTQKQQLNTQIEQSFRSVVPRGVLVDPVKQLKTRVGADSNQAQSSHAIKTLSVVAPLLAEQKALSLKSIHYNNTSGEMGINLRAQNFNAIEAFQAALKGNALNAVLIHSSADGNEQVARLKITRIHRQVTSSSTNRPSI